MNKNNNNIAKAVMVFGASELGKKIIGDLVSNQIPVSYYSMDSNTTGTFEIENVDYQIIKSELINNTYFVDGMRKYLSHIIIIVSGSDLDEEIDNLLKLNIPLIILTKKGYNGKSLTLKSRFAKVKTYIFHGLLDKVENSDKDDKILIKMIISAIDFLNKRNIGVYSPLDNVSQGRLGRKI